MGVVAHSTGDEGKSRGESRAGDSDERRKAVLDAETLVGVEPRSQVLQRYVFAVPRLGPARALFFLRTADYTVAGAWANGVQCYHFPSNPRHFDINAVADS